MRKLTKKMENRFYVYAYLDPRKPGRYQYTGLDFSFLYEPFYIGKGTNRQYNRHLRESKERTRNILKYNKIQKIKKETGNNPFIIKIKENIDEKTALAIENNFIKTIGRINIKTGCLVNLIENSVGGNANPSQETRVKLGNSTRGKTYEEIYGKDKAIELKEKRAESNKNREVSLKLRESLTKRNSKKWIVINPDGVRFEIENLKLFCENNNLTTSLMWVTAKGKQTNHKKWKCYCLL